MYERTTKVDETLKVIGIAIIVLSIIGGFIVLSIAGNSYGAGSMFGALVSVAPGIVSGILLIGFASIIRLLDEIRGLCGTAVTHGLGPFTGIVPGSIGASGGITENPDGTYSVRGKKFKSLFAAEAHLKFLEGLGK